MSIVQMRRIRKLLEIGCRTASLLNPYIKKAENRILFFESTADYMNNYALYNFMVEKKYNEKYKLYYFPDIRKDTNIEEVPPNVVFSNSLLKAFILFLTTKVVFLDTGNMRILPSKYQKVIYMDHGLPFKCVGEMSKNPDPSLPKDLIMPVNYMTSSSPNFDDIYMKSYLVNGNQLLRCGRPRTDAFFDSESHLEKIGIERTSYNKVIMWMTTYRISKDHRLVHTSEKNWSKTNLPILTSVEELKVINDELVKVNNLLIIKIHDNSLFDNNSIREFSHIKLLLQSEFIKKGFQIYDILKDFDALVTDYSSVFWDFLFVDEPIIFVTSDIEDYQRTNGLDFENPLDYMPGPKVKNLQELVVALRSIDANKSEYVDFRKKIKNFAHQYQDGKDCERILNLLGLKK